MSYKEKNEILAIYNGKSVEYDKKSETGFSHTKAAFVIGGVYFSTETTVDYKLIEATGKDNLHINNSMEMEDYIEAVTLSSFYPEIKLHLFQIAGLSQQFIVNFHYENYKGDSCGLRIRNYFDFYFKEKDVQKILSELKAKTKN